MRYLILTAALALTGCGPTVAILRDPVTGQVAQCKGDMWSADPWSDTATCIQGYEAAGYKKLSAN